VDFFLESDDRGTGADELGRLHLRIRPNGKKSLL
jgi:hypothetical protein